MTKVSAPALSTAGPPGAPTVRRTWLRRVTATAVAAGGLVVGLVAPASASTPIDAPRPSPAHIEGYYGSGMDRTPIRTGSATFGLTHIKLGGTYGHTYNHETTSYARNLWSAALNEGPKDETSWGGDMYSYRYTTSGGTRRTMCVIVDPKNWTYGAKNYGFKGIVTAYWASGWKTTYDACTSDN